MAYKCPQMNTIKFLVHKSCELGWFCTWSSSSMWHDKVRYFGGEVCEKMKFMVYEM